MKKHIENALKGAALGAINAFLVTIVMCAVSTGAIGLVLPAIFLVAMLAAVPIGAVMGVIAGLLRTKRLATLEVIALAAIPMAGAAIIGSDHMLGKDFLFLVVVAASPTMILVVILERWVAPMRATARALGLLATPSSSRPRPSAPQSAAARFRT